MFPFPSLPCPFNKTQNGEVEMICLSSLTFPINLHNNIHMQRKAAITTWILIVDESFLSFL